MPSLGYLYAESNLIEQRDAALVRGPCSRRRELVSAVARVHACQGARAPLARSGRSSGQAGSALLFKFHRHRERQLRVSDLAELLDIDTPVGDPKGSTTRATRTASRACPTPKTSAPSASPLTSPARRPSTASCSRAQPPPRSPLRRAGPKMKWRPFLASLDHFADSLTNEMENDRD